MTIRLGSEEGKGRKDYLSTNQFNASESWCSKPQQKRHGNLEMTAKIEGLTKQSEEAKRIPLNMML